MTGDYRQEIGQAAALSSTTIFDEATRRNPKSRACLEPFFTTKQDITGALGVASLWFLASRNSLAALS